MAQPQTVEQADPATPQPVRVVARSFLLARLGSLFSILPLGVWTLHHLWNNLAAFSGGLAWQDAVTAHQSAATQALTATVVIGPLLWHTGWGILRMVRSRPAPADTRFSNLRYLLQRASALGLLGFLGAHLWLAWLEPRFFEGQAEPFADITREMHHHGPTLVVYILGIVAVAYHLANGLWSFSMGWGLAVSKNALDWMERFALLAFVAFLALGWTAVYALWAAGA